MVPPGFPVTMYHAVDQHHAGHTAPHLDDLTVHVHAAATTFASVLEVVATASPRAAISDTVSEKVKNCKPITRIGSTCFKPTATADGFPSDAKHIWNGLRFQKEFV